MEKNIFLSLVEQFSDDHPFLRDSDGATGRCFWSVLMFSHFAKLNGLNVDLVRFSNRDPQFIDHWAVAFDDERVVDFTRAQVDGKAGLIFQLNQYPSNYFSHKRYPANIFISGWDPDEICQPDGEIHSTFMARMKTIRYQFDDKSFKPEPWSWKEWSIIIVSVFYFGWRLIL